jgi:hypothetical protein
MSCQCNGPSSVSELNVGFVVCTIALWQISSENLCLHASLNSTVFPSSRLSSVGDATGYLRPEYQDTESYLSLRIKNKLGSLASYMRLITPCSYILY